MLWVHFTKDIESFISSGLVKVESDDPASFAEEGLCVYKYNPDRYDEMEASWQRRGVIIEIPLEKVKLLQESPLDDPDWDEYIIPVENFHLAKIERPN